MDYDIFISYSRKDTEIANRICRAFDQAGITYFIDRQGIGGGMEFPTVLAEAILNSKLMLFLASKNSYASKFTNSEVTFAFNKKQAGSIIPYIIDDSTLPPSLEFTFSSINIRTIKEHPIETILLNDICILLKKKEVSFISGESSDYNTKTLKSKKILIGICTAIFITLIISGIFLLRHSPENLFQRDEVSELHDSLQLYNDSIKEETTQSFEVKKFEREIGKTEFLAIEYPVKGNEKLLLNIRHWINDYFEKMNIKYSGDLNDVKRTIDYYTEELKKKSSHPESDPLSYDIRKVYEDDKVVTYVFNVYIYASGYTFDFGATFRKSDGEIFSKDMIMQISILPEIWKHFRSYYGANSDAELLEIMNSQIFGSASPLHQEDIKVPHNSPWITNEGFEFNYNDGEYSQYYNGDDENNISFTIPASTMQQYLSEEGKTFIK